MASEIQHKIPCKGMPTRAGNPKFMSLLIGSEQAKGPLCVAKDLERFAMHYMHLCLGGNYGISI